MPKLPHLCREVVGIGMSLRFPEDGRLMKQEAEKGEQWQMERNHVISRAVLCYNSKIRLFEFENETRDLDNPKEAIVTKLEITPCQVQSLLQYFNEVWESYLAYEKSHLNPPADVN